MADQFSGEMLVGLERLVDKAARHHNGRAFTKTGPEDLERLKTLKAMLLSSGEEPGLPNDLKAAWIELIDLSLSKNPDPAKITASTDKIQRLSPPCGSKAIGIGPR